MPTDTETEQIQVVVLDNPLEDAHRERADLSLDYREGLTVRDVLPERVTPDHHWIVVENGCVIPPDEWAARLVAPTTNIVCYRRLHGAAGRIIAGVLLAAVGAVAQFGFGQPWGTTLMFMGAGMIIGGAAELLIGSPTVPLIGNSSSESSPTYGFSGIKNSLRIGSPIQVVYGTHRVAGQFIEIKVRAQTTALNSNGTGTIQTIYTEIRVDIQDDYGTVVDSYLADQYIRVLGSGTQFVTALTPGARIRAGGKEFAVRSIISATEFHAHYSGQQDLAAGHSFSHIRNVPSTGDNDVLSMLIALSEGEVESITDIKIQGQVLANYKDVTSEIKYGTNNQTAITLFGDGVTSLIGADAAITETFLSYTTAGTNLTALEMEIQFPNGLFTVGNGGGLGPATVDLTVEYKLTSAGSWTAFGTASFTDAKRSALHRNIRIEGLAPGQYDLRIQRGNPESTGLTLVDTVRRTSISEIVNDAYIYPNTALLGVSMVATDRISGGLPTVTASLQGVKIKKFSSATACTVAWTNNPAWVVLDMLTNRRYGMGQFTWPMQLSGSWTFTSGLATVAGTGFTNKIRKGQKILVWLTSTSGAIYTVLSVDSNIQFTMTTNFSGGTAAYSAEAHRNDLDLASFVAWAAFCDTLVSDGNGGTEKRATCDIVFDQQGSNIWDAANKVCGLGLASLVKLGNYITVKYQQAETPVQLFTMANIVAGSFKETFLALDKRSNVFEVAYLNAANDYNQEMITIEDPLLYTNSEQERKQTIQVYGATRQGHAARLARFYANANRYLTRSIEFATGIDAIACEPVDVINFQHDVPQWGFGGRAIAGSTTSTIVLDQAMTIAAGTYNVMVRFSSDDTVQTKTVTNGAGTYTTLTISGTWDGGKIPVDGDVFAFGLITIVTKPFRVLSVERTSEFDGKLTCIEDNAALYDETGLTPINVVQYSALPDLSGPPPQVTELSMTQLDNDTIIITFSPPTDGRYKTTYLFRMTEGRAELLGEARNGSFILTGMSAGEMLVVRAVAVSHGGVQASINAAPMAALNVMLRALPPNVTGLELAGQGNDTAFVGKDAKFGWKRSSIDGAGSHGLGHETTGAGSGTSSVFRQYRVEIYNTDGTTLRRREYTQNTTYVYSFEKNHEDAQQIASGAVVRTFTIKVWAEDIYNQLSFRPAILTVANAAPALLGNFAVTPLSLSGLFSWDKPTEIDATGVGVWVSTSAGFTPGPANRRATVAIPGTMFLLENLVVGTTYYVRAAAFDTFGEDAINYSAQLSLTPLGIVQTQLASGLKTIEVVATLPAPGTQGRTVFLTTDNKLYRDTGSIWTKATDGADIIADSITGGQIAAGAVGADEVAANIVDAIHLRTDVAVITVAAQIATAIINNAHIVSLSADKFIAGIITVLVRLGVNNIELDGVNSVITIKDTQGTPVTRVKIGKLAAGTTDWGIQIYNAAGVLMFDATAGGVTAAGVKAGVIDSTHLRTDTAVITGTAQMATAIIKTAQIDELQVTTLRIANNAVSNKAEARSTDVDASSASFVDIVTVSVTTQGGSVFVMARCGAIVGASEEWSLQLLRDSTIIDGPISSFGGSFAISILADLDAPAAGTYTYKLQGKRVTGTPGTMNYLSNGIWATEYLK